MNIRLLCFIAATIFLNKGFSQWNNFEVQSPLKISQFMDKFKIELFKNEYDKPFPFYRKLSLVECNQIIEIIIKRYEINDGSRLVTEIYNRQFFWDKENAKVNFSFLETLHKFSINSLPKIYIKWYRYEQIDELDIDTFHKYFYDIWFPSADDIDIFDSSLEWILSIRHDGAIYCL